MITKNLEEPKTCKAVAQKGKVISERYLCEDITSPLDDISVSTNSGSPPPLPVTQPPIHTVATREPESSPHDSQRAKEISEKRMYWDNLFAKRKESERKPAVDKDNDLSTVNQTENDIGISEENTSTGDDATKPTAVPGNVQSPEHLKESEKYTEESDSKSVHIIPGKTFVAQKKGFWDDLIARKTCEPGVNTTFIVQRPLVSTHDRQDRSCPVEMVTDEVTGGDEEICTEIKETKTVLGRKLSIKIKSGIVRANQRLYESGHEDEFTMWKKSKECKSLGKHDITQSPRKSSRSVSTQKQRRENREPELVKDQPKVVVSPIPRHRKLKKGRPISPRPQDDQSSSGEDEQSIPRVRRKTSVKIQKGLVKEYKSQWESKCSKSGFWTWKRHRLQYSPSKPKSSPVKRQTKRQPRKSPTTRASPVSSYTARYLDTPDKIPKSPTKTRKEWDQEMPPPPSPPVDRPLTPEETEEFLQDIRGRVASQRKRFDSLGSVISESSGNSLDAVDAHTNHTAKSSLDLDEDYISCIVGKVSKRKKLWETKTEEKSQRNKDNNLITKAQASRIRNRGKPQSPTPTRMKGKERVTYIIHSTIEGDVVLETVDGTYSSHQELWDIQTRKQQHTQRLQASGESMKVERKGADISEISRAHPRGDVDELVAAASATHTTSDIGDHIPPDEETRSHSPVITNPSPHSSSWPSPQSCSPTQSAGEHPIEASAAAEEPAASETAQYYQSYKHTFASARSFFESVTHDQNGVELNNYTKYEDRHKSLTDFVVTEQVNVSCNDSETWNYSSQGLNSPSNPIESAATDTDLEVDDDSVKAVYNSQDMNYTRHSRKEAQECETRLVDSGCQTDDEFDDTPRSRIYRVNRACQSDPESDNELSRVRDHSPSRDQEIQVSEDDLTNPLKRRLPHDYRQYDLLENPKSKRRIYQRRTRSQTLARSKSLPGTDFATIPSPKHNRTTINPLGNFWSSEPEDDRPRSYKFGISDSSSLVASLMDLTRDLPTAYPDSHNQDDLEDLDHDVFQHFPQGEVIQTLSGCYWGEFPHIPVNGRTQNLGRVPRAGQRDLISLRELRRRASLPECLALLPSCEVASPESGSPVEVIRNPFHPMDQITAQLMRESSVDNCENGTYCMYNSSESINLSVNSDASEKHNPVCDGATENEQIADSDKEEWDTYGEATTDSNCEIEDSPNESRNCVEATPNPTCSAYGDGLERGKTGEVLTFIVDTAGAQQGEVTISVDGPFKGSVSGTEVYPIEEYAGAYLVNYMVNTPAPYKVGITWSGQHIAGSPFTCIVEA
ncbi:uncharacterized protein LOC119577818 [Penaeus monodon]|uniref:uncharacterized protein LOC119577818 n=1 Tax=Penaeus monodon TaxID=6687 RepID=UPI0018A79E31|nr:uncharacterized protein LOC119577818 [Penaeus monodon]